MAFVAIVAGYRRAAPPGRPAAQPGRRRAAVTGAGVQHVGQLRDEHELAELLRRDRRQLPDPGDACWPSATSRPRRPAWPSRSRSIRGLTRRELEDDRQLLGRPDPRRPLHPAADLDRRRARPRLAGRPADVRRPADRSRRSRVPSRRSPTGRSPRRSGSRSWATTAAASSTPTRPTRSRTRRRSRTGSRCSPSSLMPVLADLHLRPVRRRPAPGLDDLRRDGRDPASSARSSR